MLNSNNYRVQSINNDINNILIDVEEEKTDKSLNQIQYHNFITYHKKLFNISTNNKNQENVYETETFKFENDIECIDISKQLKAFKIKDILSINQRILQEDNYYLFYDKCIFFSSETRNISSYLQVKVYIYITDQSNIKKRRPKAKEENKSLGDYKEDTGVKYDHLNDCILYWTSVVIPKKGSRKENIFQTI